jgi:serine/threonine protein kinase
VDEPFINDDNYYIVTELGYCSLKDKISKNRADGVLMGGLKFVSIMIQIAEGMEYLHSLPIVHRDLKPENVLLTEDNDVLICDFGLSKVLDSQSQSMKSLGVGTMGYQAPECLGGLNPLEDKANSEVASSFKWHTDVWAFGVTMYNSAFMVDLFSGVVADDIISKPLDRVVLPYEFGPEFNEMFLRILSRNPQDRPSFTEIVGLLRIIKEEGAFAEESKADTTMVNWEKAIE